MPELTSVQASATLQSTRAPRPPCFLPCILQDEGGKEARILSQCSYSEPQIYFRWCQSNWLKIICPFAHLHNFAYLFNGQVNSFGVPHCFSFPPTIDLSPRSGSALVVSVLTRETGTSQEASRSNIPEFSSLSCDPKLYGSAEIWARLNDWKKWRVRLGLLLGKISSRQVVRPPCRQVCPWGRSCCHCG